VAYSSHAADWPSAAGAKAPGPPGVGGATTRGQGKKKKKEIALSGIRIVDRTIEFAALSPWSKSVIM
jgi:hypothetical protein